MTHYHIWTIGCQMNDADSRRAAEELQRLGYLPTPRAEEAGISIEEPRLRDILTETSPTDYNWIVYIYAADIPAIPPVECAEGTLEWVSPERLDTIPMPTTDGFIYDYVSRSEFFVLDAVYNENVELIRLVDELSGRVLFGE